MHHNQHQQKSSYWLYFEMYFLAMCLLSDPCGLDTLQWTWKFQHFPRLHFPPKFSLCSFSPAHRMNCSHMKVIMFYAIVPPGWWFNFLDTKWLKGSRSVRKNELWNISCRYIFRIAKLVSMWNVHECLFILVIDLKRS